jgi:maltose O-acetyltransferase
MYYKILSTNKRIIGKPRLNQPILALGPGTIIFEGKVNIGCYPSPYFFNSYAHFDTRGNNSRIEIGNGTWINNNATLIADGAKIIIEKNVLIGPNLQIYTSDFHGLHPDKRLSPDYPKEDVIIEDNVFLGSNVTILRGVRIGKNSVIANGAIISKDIPENVIAGGIPCKVIKSL